MAAERKYLNREGKKAVFDAARRVHHYKYDDPVVKVIEQVPVSCYLVESSLGEQRLIIADATTKIEVIVDIVKQSKWRAEFTVSRVDAANVQLAVSPSNRFLSHDPRKINQNGEVVI